jgi:hypothetical protein
MLVSGKFVTFIAASIISALINLIFIGNLSNDTIKIGALTFPPSIIMIAISLTLEASKLLHVIQYNTLNELYRKLQGFEGIEKIKKVARTWFIGYLMYAALAIIASVNFSVGNLGRSNTQADETISVAKTCYDSWNDTQKQIDDLNSQIDSVTSSEKSTWDSMVSLYSSIPENEWSISPTPANVQKWRDFRTKVKVAVPGATDSSIKSGASWTKYITYQTKDINSKLTEAKQSLEDIKSESSKAGYNSYIALKTAQTTLKANKVINSGSQASFDIFANMLHVPVEGFRSVMLLILSLLIELTIYQTSPKVQINRKMLYQFTQYLPANFNVNKFMDSVDKELVAYDMIQTTKKTEVEINKQDIELEKAKKEAEKAELRKKAAEAKRAQKVAEKLAAKEAAQKDAIESKESSDEEKTSDENTSVVEKNEVATSNVEAKTKDNNSHEEEKVPVVLTTPEKMAIDSGNEAEVLNAKLALADTKKKAKKIKKAKKAKKSVEDKTIEKVEDKVVPEKEVAAVSNIPTDTTEAKENTVVENKVEDSTSPKEDAKEKSVEETSVSKDEPVEEKTVEETSSSKDEPAIENVAQNEPETKIEPEKVEETKVEKKEEATEKVEEKVATEPKNIEQVKFAEPPVVVKPVVQEQVQEKVEQKPLGEMAYYRFGHTYVSIKDKFVEFINELYNGIDDTHAPYELNNLDVAAMHCKLGDKIKNVFVKRLYEMTSNGKRLIYDKDKHVYSDFTKDFIIDYTTAIIH